jgi:hypothetical protein
MEKENIFPKVPEITDKQLIEARESGRYESIAFEEYKFTAQLVAIVARIDKSSKVLKSISSQQYNVLIGLMNRCARLILGTMELSHKGKFGETTAIILRCIFETGIKIVWLCIDGSQNKFELYINDSLKPEIELKDKIKECIEKRKGRVVEIENRMLDSIKYHIKEAQTSEEKIRNSKKMPDIATLVKNTNFDRIMYLVNYRLGSHHIHGTWPSLLFHYLEKADDGFIPRGNNVATRANELLMTSLIMSRAIHEYSNYVLTTPFADILKNLCKEEEKTILMIVDDMTRHGQ